MNNIRKIIEERLENAKLNYNQHSEIKEPIIKHYFKGQRHAYEDCLNLIDEYTPKIVTKQLSVKEIETLLQDLNKPHQFIIDKPASRTEQEILKDFEALGWIVSLKDNLDITLRYKEYKNCTIWIDKINRGYSCNTGIDMQEHKLLNELFEVWQW